MLKDLTMSTSATTIALAMFKQRIVFEDYNDYSSQLYDNYSRNDIDYNLIRLRDETRKYKEFLTSPRASTATQAKADILEIDPNTLNEKLHLVGYSIIEQLIDEETKLPLQDDWIENVYKEIAPYYDFQNEGDLELTDEVKSLAAYFNLQTDLYMQNSYEIKKQYHSLIGSFRGRSSTYITDSGYWYWLFVEGLDGFLGIAQKQDFKVNELSSQLHKCLGSERLLITIQGLDASENQQVVTFAQAFEKDVQYFSRTGTFSHTISDGKIALKVTIQNLGDNEALLYKNGQSQYWRLGSLITI
jgi:hypothetical protein